MAGLALRRPLPGAARSPALFPHPMPLPWEHRRQLPLAVRSALAALRFTAAAPLPSLSERDQKALLEFCDRNQLTLFFSQLPSRPQWLEQALQTRLRATCLRLARLEREIIAVSEALDQSGIPYLMLKGLTRWPASAKAGLWRVPYDLDLYCPETRLSEAQAAIERLGYSPLHAREEDHTDHLAPLIRKTAWRWKGDYFDPEIPFTVELHFRFWDHQTEGFAAPGTEAFWQRRIRREILGRSIFVLQPADALAYSALHALRHLLRGSLRLCHAWELGRLLDETARDDAFWAQWARLHPDGLRRLQAVAFRLAWEWFDCRLAPVVSEEIRRLPHAVHSWFERSAASAVESLFRPNKDELSLHLALIDSPAERRKVLLRRLFPRRLPPGRAAVQVPADQMTPAVRWRARLWYAREVSTRAWFHLRTLPGALLCLADTWRSAR